jgi:hypothetical protein
VAVRSHDHNLGHHLLSYLHQVFVDRALAFVEGKIVIILGLEVLQLMVYFIIQLLFFALTTQKGFEKVRGLDVSQRHVIAQLIPHVHDAVQGVERVLREVDRYQYRAHKHAFWL